jgi:hypothetical protein
MNNCITLIGISLALSLSACDPDSDKAIQSTMTESEIKTELNRILGFELPKSSRNLNGDSMSVLNYIFDCVFECQREELEEAWHKVTMLHEMAPLKNYKLNKNVPTMVFQVQEAAPGGSQSISIAIGELSDGWVRVEIQSTHIKKRAQQVAPSNR